MLAADNVSVNWMLEQTEMSLA